MNKDEMIKNDRRKIMDLLCKLKNGELCTPNCYGCCGDNELSFAYCPDVTDNFEKELANLGYRKVEDDKIVIKKQAYEKFVEEFAKQEEIAHSYEQGYTELLETNHRLQDELEKSKQEKREILQVLKNNIIEVDFGCGAGVYEVVDMDTDELKKLAKSYGIETED